MSERKENACPGAATSGQAVEMGTDEKKPSTSTKDFTTYSENGQSGIISRLLMAGSENGLHLSDLVRLTKTDSRAVRNMIHAERRRGIPILSDNVNGYFLPSNEREREKCINSLRHRAESILAAADAIEKRKW